jgi:hypothetical protein
MQRGPRWTVREVLGGWTHPGWPGKAHSKPVVEKRYRLRVFGPLPGQPDQLGEFVMIATAYGSRDRWWIRPEAWEGSAERRAELGKGQCDLRPLDSTSAAVDAGPCGQQPPR